MWNALGDLATATTVGPGLVLDEDSTAASGVTAELRTGEFGCTDAPTALTKMIGAMTANPEATRARAGVRAPRTRDGRRAPPTSTARTRETAPVAVCATRPARRRAALRAARPPMCTQPSLGLWCL